jgi:hypothetical protein
MSYHNEEEDEIDKADETDEEIGTFVVPPSGSLFIGSVKNVLSTLFLSFVALSIFFYFSNQIDQWILLLLEVDLLVLFVRKAVTNGLYRRNEASDYDQMALLQIIDFIHATIITLIGEFILLILTFQTAISTLYWYNGIFILALVTVVVYVLLAKLV